MSNGKLPSHLDVHLPELLIEVAEMRENGLDAKDIPRLKKLALSGRANLEFYRDLDQIQAGWYLGIYNWAEDTLSKLQSNAG